MTAATPGRDGGEVIETEPRRHIVIPGGHNGPAGSANGGVAAGLLASRLPGTVEVVLRRPPPLDTPLSVQAPAAGVLDAVLAGETVMTAASAPALEFEAPSVSLDAAARVTGPSPDHLAPTCVVCGPDREDGLGVLPGAVLGLGVHAAAWTPPPWAADAAGCVRPELVWGALDCPGAFALLDGPLPDGCFPALARITAALLQPVPVGEAVVVMGWPEHHDGRRFGAATVITAADGTVLAAARQVCVAVDVSFARRA